MFRHSGTETYSMTNPLLLPTQRLTDAHIQNLTRNTAALHRPILLFQRRSCMALTRRLESVWVSLKCEMILFSLSPVMQWLCF